MSVPPPATELDQLAARPFSFYPPIVGVEHNEWIFRRATWSEMLVANSKSQEELWVPRRFVGQISSVDEPVMIVGLLKELELKLGQVMPHERRVIEMPKVYQQTSPVEGPPLPPPTRAMVVGIRLNDGNESKLGLIIGASLILGILACFIVVSTFRGGGRVEYHTLLQEDLGLTSADDYFAVVRKLGAPASDRWRDASGGLEYQAMSYPDRHLTVVLMGVERKNVRYIGAVNDQWKPVHTVDDVGHHNTRALLEGLRPF
jgi:hypothetical protein